MTNRFSYINDGIADSACQSQGVLVKRTFAAVEGDVEKHITNEFISLENLSEDEEKIVQEGVPVYKNENGIFYEPFFKEERIIILGAGHVAVPLSMMAKLVGFYVVVIDDRADFADAKRFPYADEVICDSFFHALETVAPKPSDYVVIITRGHANDRECLECLARFPEPVYTGLIGSKKRVATVFDNLKTAGYDEDRLDRVHTPIGLDIGAKTIEEIDIAIIAEIIKVRRMDSVGKTLVDRGDHDMKVLSDLAKISTPCAIATILKAEGSTPRGAGAVMAIFMDGTLIGSIGGGCVEGAVIHLAKKIIGSGSYKILEIGLDGKSAMAEGMVCGGNLVVLIEDFRGEI